MQETDETRARLFAEPRADTDGRGGAAFGLGGGAPADPAQRPAVSGAVDLAHGGCREVVGYQNCGRVHSRAGFGWIFGFIKADFCKLKFVFEIYRIALNWYRIVELSICNLHIHSNFIPPPPLFA